VVFFEIPVRRDKKSASSKKHCKEISEGDFKGTSCTQVIQETDNNDASVTFKHVTTAEGYMKGIGEGKFEKKRKLKLLLKVI
jgi:hypothetical protein